jgi:uncharacterized protein with NRDE domain
LGLNKKTKILAILTNFDSEEWIEIKDLVNYGRGMLVLKFLDSKEEKISDERILEKMNLIMSEKEKFNSFNLIVGNLESMNFFYISNGKH